VAGNGNTKKFEISPGTWPGIMDKTNAGPLPPYRRRFEFQRVAKHYHIKMLKLKLELDR